MSNAAVRAEHPQHCILITEIIRKSSIVIGCRLSLGVAEVEQGVEVHRCIVIANGRYGRQSTEASERRQGQHWAATGSDWQAVRSVGRIRYES